MMTDALSAATAVRPFSQRLTPGFYDRVRRDSAAGLADAGLDALVTDSPDDVAYLTGFFHHPGERPVAVWLPAEGPVVLLVPELERENAQRQCAAADLVSFPEFPGVVPPFRALADHVTSGGRTAHRRIGFAPSMSWSRLSALGREFTGADLAPADLLIEQRYRKRPEEIALHREAARVTDRMIDAGLDLVRDAVASGGTLPTEAELASHVTAVGVNAMYSKHDDVVVVSPLAGALVYAGANSAFPHGLPSGYRLRPGDTFVLSLGCAVGGRFVEGERTFVLGKPSADQRRYHDAVALAQRVGGEAIAPGAECRSVDRACYDVIRDAGLGEFIRHRQGHGIGLGMHEPPWLEAGDGTVLEPGMIVSNEPGLYIPGHAGYRISDSMLVTNAGSEPLTGYPRTLDDCIIAL